MIVIALSLLSPQPTPVQQSSNGDVLAMLIKKPTYILLLTLIFCGILGLLAIIVRYNKLFNDSSAWVNHTIRVLEEGERTRSSLYRYDIAKEDVQALTGHFLVLRNMTSDNGLQERRIDSLMGLVAGQQTVTGQNPGPVAQKGVVDSESRPGGTIFTVTLPVNS
ncbi:MAG TPA: hypothetical protein VL978_07955 [Puia sp.]|nr:hypothetical protein [Puia sp.]